MLCLRFELDGQACALPVAAIREVLPWREPRPLPGLPPFVRGVFRHRGRPIPLLDGCMLVGGEGCPPRISSRVLVLDLDDDPQRPFGLLVERATDTVEVDPEEGPAARPLALDATPWLAELGHAGPEAIQLLRPHGLLPGKALELLYPGYCTEAAVMETP
ncbi:MAG TPA: purine-binding chemotaxis protein CheW [Thiotrichales bacterium]|nr:purine-binding chemotaxis protein CheW [Thiotrichales bacterium]